MKLINIQVINIIIMINIIASYFEPLVSTRARVAARSSFILWWYCSACVSSLCVSLFMFCVLTWFDYLAIWLFGFPAHARVAARGSVHDLVIWLFGILVIEFNIIITIN